MKRLFKHIIRKVNEKVSNTIKDTKELINTVKDKMKNKDDIINLCIISTSVGVALLSFSACMCIKVKTM